MGKDLRCVQMHQQLMASCLSQPPQWKVAKKVNQLLLLGEPSKACLQKVNYLFAIIFPQEAKLLDKCIRSIHTTWAFSSVWPHDNLEICEIKPGKRLIAKHFFLGVVLEESTSLLLMLLLKTLKLTKMQLSSNKEVSKKITQTLDN